MNYKFGERKSAKAAVGLLQLLRDEPCGPRLYVQSPTGSPAPLPKARRILTPCFGHYCWRTGVRQRREQSAHCRDSLGSQFPARRHRCGASSEISRTTPRQTHRAAARQLWLAGQPGFSLAAGLCSRYQSGVDHEPGSRQEGHLGGADLLAAHRAQRGGSEPDRLRLLRRPHQHRGSFPGGCLQPHGRDHHHRSLRGSPSAQRERPDSRQQPGHTSGSAPHSAINCCSSI